MALLIHAPNVHTGGGKSLLLSLLHAAENKISVIAILDQRLAISDELEDKINCSYVKPGLLSRLLAEFSLFSKCKEKDQVLCFGNLPPIFKLKGKTALFIQNRYLVDAFVLRGFSVRVKARIFVERLWLKLFHKHVDVFIVQTPCMQALVEKIVKKPVHTLPFFDFYALEREMNRCKEKDIGEKYDFLYVASGEPHKNHCNLLEAWRLLAEDNVFPSLCLTLSKEKDAEIVNLIENVTSKYNLKISIIGQQERQDMAMIYQACNALIYPSTFESLGLPLIEANSFALPIIASELDFVRDILDPVETFDPASPLSIKRAIERFIFKPEKKIKIIGPDNFINELMIIFKN